MLDLSAAFDTVGHTILLNRLERRLGVTGSALQWFRSYLSGRVQRVVVNGVSSDPTALSCGVPQGSVLGPLLFTIYTLPLGDIIRNHGIPYHMYADDSQKYAIFKLHEYCATITKMESLVCDIRSWYAQNMLKCNDPKTDMMVISSKYQPISDHLPLKVGNCDITATKKIRNLGVIMDEHLTMVSHVNHIVQLAFLKIREISYYRKFLTSSATKTLVHAYITSRLDYCNGLLCGLPNSLTGCKVY